jgi:hypothetical protein
MTKDIREKWLGLMLVSEQPAELTIIIIIIITLLFSYHRFSFPWYFFS